MDNRVNIWRVLLKAFILVVIANFTFVWLSPSIGKFTIYNHLVPGRVRFPFEREPSLYSVGYNVPVFENFDAMFGSHIISVGQKPADEFRLILLGDSSTWGGHVGPDEMLAEQINRLGLRSCDGRRIVAYNLGYPFPSVLRDVLILDRAIQYQPDMVVWLVTLHSFELKPSDSEFLIPHAERINQLAAEYKLDIPTAYLHQTNATLWDDTLFGQRRLLKKIVLNQFYGIMWAATGIDNSNGLSKTHPIFSPDVPADVSYFDYSSPGDAPALIHSLTLDVLRAGEQIANGAPLVVINEPIFIANGQNSELRYNSLYPRWAYDAYRASLADWTRSNGITYFDDWDTLPASLFANDTFHRDPSGEKQFANLLAPTIKKFACP